MAAKKTEVQAAAPVQAQTPAPKPDEELPEITTLGVYKKGKVYSILAVKTQGRKVLDQAVMTQTDFRLEALSDLAEYCESVFVGNMDPFKERA